MKSPTLYNTHKVQLPTSQTYSSLSPGMSSSATLLLIPGLQPQKADANFEHPGSTIHKIVPLLFACLFVLLVVCLGILATFLNDHTLI